MYLEKTEPRSVADAATRVFYCGLAICAVIYGIACSDPKTHNGPVPSPSPQEREHLRSVVASLPAENFDRLMVEGGNFGDGVRQSWMDAMKRHDVKAAKVEVHLTWFFGPRSPKATEVLYFSDYGGAQQVVDEALLSQLRHDGLEDALKRAALAHAPEGNWMELPHSVFRPFQAATTVTLFDDEWLPIPSHFFREL